MDQQFNIIGDRDITPENEIFRVVFYPDRIYHDAYFNATVSQRYRYYVHEVRSKHDITLIKAEVYMDGKFMANMFRIEYRASRLIETARERERFLQSSVSCNLKMNLEDGRKLESDLKLDFCNWVRAFQCEIWDNLEPVTGARHHYKVLSQMGEGGSIIHLSQFDEALKQLKEVKEFQIFFWENDIDEPFGYKIDRATATIDNDYLRSYQVPNSDRPSDPGNTVDVHDYLINFRRGWFLDSADIKPVRYKNAMMESINPAHRDDDTNIVEMKWILQRELGGSLVYFHEVNVTPGSFEGVHQHIGSEELYYIVSGEGIAYMGHDDDPNFADETYPIVKQEIFCLGEQPVREITVKPGKVIYTKSGGIHGIKNTSDTVPLIFVAFGYHSS
jgi:mannose-6-phosphate isomerase-like protein (cupin superfamily)